MIFLLCMQSLVTAESALTSSAVLCVTAAPGSKLNTWEEEAGENADDKAYTHTRVWNTANARETATAMFLRVLTHRTQCQDTDLMKDEGTLQATLAGSICLEVALGVFQTGKH